MYRSFFLLPLIALGLVFAVPLARAVLHGVRIARDPARRMTLMDSRTLFRRTALKDLRWWFPLWCLILLVSPLLVVRFPTPSVYSGGPWGVTWSFNYWAFFVSMILGWWSLMFASCMVWAPQCKEMWSLIVLMLFTSVIIYSLVTISMTPLVPHAWYHHMWHTVPNRITTRFNVFPVYNLIPCCILAAVVWRWSSRRGQLWFRFQD